MSAETEPKNPQYLIDVRQLKNTKFTKTEEDGKTTFSLEPTEGPEIKDALAEMDIKPYTPPEAGTTPDSPPKGSIISADPPKKGANESIETKGFDSVSEMISDLYSLRKSDPKTEKALDKLWSRAVDELKAVEAGEKKLSFQVLQCPDCGGAVMRGQPCVKCGWRGKF